jgi:hypothetical protein
MKQQTPEWFAARLGKATGSRISDIVAKTKTGYAASREDYMFQLVHHVMSVMKQMPKGLRFIH